MKIEQKRSIKAGLSKRMKREAARRKCPRCCRNSAINKMRDKEGGGITRWCIYCDYEEFYYLPNSTQTHEH